MQSGETDCISRDIINLLCNFKLLNSDDNLYRGGMDANSPETVQRLQREFRESLDFLISLENIIDMTHLNLLKQQETIYNSTFDRFNYVISRSKLLKNEFEFVLLDNLTMVQDYIDTIEELKDKLINQKFSITSMDIILLIHLIQQALRAIKLNNYKEVTFEPIQNYRVISALSNYVNTAKLIRLNGYENSVAANLEKIIAGDFNLCKKLVGLSVDSQHDFAKSFIAIAAPSLEGKTQFAFVLEKTRPLYFALGAWDSSSGGYATQPIYLNYKALNIFIERVAKDDLRRILADEPRQELKNIINEYCAGGKSKAENPGVLLRITADELMLHLNEKKLYTLGLFYKLVEDARMNYDIINVESRPPWMQYHANRTNFNVTPISISQIPFNFFEGYCLFLDEFRGDDWAIYIRNLARAVNLRCCVSNTNAKIVNLVGKHQSRMSGTAGNSIWSIVVTELKLSNYATLNALTNIEDGISWIYENVISDDHEDDKKLFKTFFKDFKENQIQNLRPGVSLYVAKFINSVIRNRNPDSEKVTFESFFSDLVGKLGENLETRKPLVTTSVQGRAANLSLLLSPSYNIQKNEVNLNSSTNYLEDHFYYLINPSNPTNWLFLTCPSEKNKVSSPLDFLEGTGRRNWKAELTFFKSNEILTILGCMNLFYYEEESLTLILDEVFEISRGLSFDTGSAGNPLAEKRDGNRLEVLSTLCSSHSSHHDPLATRNTFKGQSGSQFFMNLLSDLMISSSKYPINFNYDYAELENFDIQKYLEEEVLIPFLYVSNFELPQVFQEMMERSNILNRSINMGKLTRTTDKSRIDIQFPFYNHGSNQNYNCKIECKNWKNNVLYSDLLEIVKHALDINQLSMNIVICDQIGNPIGKTAKHFSNYCCDKQINVYRFVSSSTLSTFYLDPLSEFLSESPLLVVIIIELKVVNASI